MFFSKNKVPVSVSGLWKSRSPASRPSIPLKIGTEQVLIDMFNIYFFAVRPSTYAHHASPFSVKFLIPDSIFRAVVKWQPFSLRNGQFCFCSSLVRHSDDPGNRLCRHGAESAVGLRSTSRKLIPKVSNQDWDQKSAFFRN